MSDKPSNDRLVENEQLLRDKNTIASESIKKYFGDTQEVTESPIAFVCECSKLNCNEHVNLSIGNYEQLHQRKDHFMIFKGHVTPAVEKVIARHKGFDIAEKFALDA